MISSNKLCSSPPGPPSLAKHITPDLSSHCCLLGWHRGVIFKGNQLIYLFGDVTMLHVTMSLLRGNLGLSGCEACTRAALALQIARKLFQDIPGPRCQQRQGGGERRLCRTWWTEHWDHAILSITKNKNQQTDKWVAFFPYGDLELFLLSTDAGLIGFWYRISTFLPERALLPA